MENRYDVLVIGTEIVGDAVAREHGAGLGMHLNNIVDGNMLIGPGNDCTDHADDHTCTAQIVHVFAILVWSNHARNARFLLVTACYHNPLEEFPRPNKYGRRRQACRKR